MGALQIKSSPLLPVLSATLQHGKRHSKGPLLPTQDTSEQAHILGDQAAPSPLRQQHELQWAPAGERGDVPENCRAAPLCVSRTAPAAWNYAVGWGEAGKVKGALGKRLWSWGSPRTAGQGLSIWGHPKWVIHQLAIEVRAENIPPGKEKARRARAALPPRQSPPLPLTLTLPLPLPKPWGALSE